MRAGLALLILAAGLAACSSRERLNPFDPGNPQTHGRPAGFAALAGDGIVNLQWQPASGAGLLGFRLERSVDGDRWISLGDLPPGANGYPDFDVTNGIEYRYHLSFLLIDGPGQPVEDVTTPGPLRPWVTDFEGNRLLRLTPDGRRVAFSDPELAGPSQIDGDPTSGAIWCCDTFGDRLVIYVPGVPRRQLIPNIPGPIAVGVDRGTQAAWVCESTNDRVIHIDVSGKTVLPALGSAVYDPVAVAVDPVDHSIWIGEGRGNMIRRFDAQGRPAGSDTVLAPSRIALDSLTGAAWVTSFSHGLVYVVTAAGTVFDTVPGFRGPIGIAVDTRRGRVWVADAVAGTVVALRRGTSVEFRVPGLPEVREIAVDLATGEAWATVAGDGSVVRISDSGTVLTRLTGLGNPYDITIDPGRR